MNFHDAYYILLAKVADAIDLLCDSELEKALGLLVKTMRELELRYMLEEEEGTDLHLLSE